MSREFNGLGQIRTTALILAPGLRCQACHVARVMPLNMQRKPMSSAHGLPRGTSDHSNALDGFRSRSHPCPSRRWTLQADPDELREQDQDHRQRVEQFIRSRFEQAFGSRVHAFMPRLFSLQDSEGSIRAALGLRSAIRPLFLEQYLDAPIEMAIAAHTGIACPREAVVEVGHLSGTYPGAVRRMIGLLTQRLHDEGVRWVAFTGTPSLRNAFRRMGLSPIEIAPANRERLAESERAAWGRYYDDAPRVFFGNVQEGHWQLSLQSTGVPAALAAHP